MLSHISPWTCSPPGSSVHGLFQARILKWAAISFSSPRLWRLLRWHVISFPLRHITHSPFTILPPKPFSSQQPSLSLFQALIILSWKNLLRDPPTPIYILHCHLNYLTLHLIIMFTLIETMPSKLPRIQNNPEFINSIWLICTFSVSYSHVLYNSLCKLLTSIHIIVFHASVPVYVALSFT